MSVCPRSSCVYIHVSHVFTSTCPRPPKLVRDSFTKCVVSLRRKAIKTASVASFKVESPLRPSRRATATHTTVTHTTVTHTADSLQQLSCGDVAEGDRPVSSIAAIWRLSVLLFLFNTAQITNTLSHVHPPTHGGETGRVNYSLMPLKYQPYLSKYIPGWIIIVGLPSLNVCRL